MITFFGPSNIRENGKLLKRFVTFGKNGSLGNRYERINPQHFQYFLSRSVNDLLVDATGSTQ